MDIHPLMQQFALFEGARVGRGPNHPTAPNLTIVDEVAAFLERYSFVQRDQGYVAFLESYAGASVLQAGTHVTVDILGFAGASICSHMFELEEDIIDEAGYFMYGYIILDNKPLGSKQISFGFDATQERQHGIYRYAYIGDGAAQKQWHWYCADFLEWLTRLIRYHGRLDD
jgi:hypothetical protein